MNQIGDPERITQSRVMKLLDEELGYDYLGDWSERQSNTNVEPDLLRTHLMKVGYSETQAARATDLLATEARRPGRDPYDANKAVYQLLRYGADVQVEAGQPVEKVMFIDWEYPENNDFAVAEEVTLQGDHERRPDVVLYINGIAFGVLELKNSRVSVETGIRQNLSNQRPEFNAWFFSTVQLVLAGNDSQGLRYGTVGTPEKFFVSWKEDEDDNTRIKLDKYLLKMCEKARVLEFIRDFVLFDAGVKKVPRPHQYFAVKAAQERTTRLEGGVIWHTQGSGKSIVMVLLAKWLLRTRPNARVLVVTDRVQLDKQIAGVFAGTDEQILRTSSAADLLANLGQATPRLMCSLVHKFGKRDVEDFDAFIKDLGSKPSPTVGELFVFVDECHRTQSGRLHKAMEAIMPGAVFIGFTGTPLLKKDARTTFETFGSYIHTYKFREAVDDGVVLDFTYEAREVEQTMGSSQKIDEWFDAKTVDLNDWQRDELRSQWGTMQQVRSSKSRISRIVQDVVFDFATKPQLRAPECLGNAILVASSIYEACKYYEMFQGTPLKDKVALVTSYSPTASDVTLEETGANTQTDAQFIYDTYTELLEGVQPAPNKSAAETYRDQAEDRFVNEPARMRLVIVVDMLLTGFDPPDCAVMYIDKQMQDHGLFQAICRTNRVSGAWKLVGSIVDYKDLFTKVENSIAVYSSELDHTEGGVSPEIMLQDRLDEGKARLTNALLAADGICEHVLAPRQELNYIHYFCGNSEIESDLENTQERRQALYTAVVSVVRAYANIADSMTEAGYSGQEKKAIKAKVERYVRLRDTIRQASGESLDLKAYEADMRQLIDVYIEAEDPKKISSFSETPLLEILVKSGVLDAIESLPDPIKSSEKAVAETITNNVRTTIKERRTSDPAYYDRMSTLLAQIVSELRAKQISYQEYLKQIAELAAKVETGADDTTPSKLTTSGTRVLFSNLPGESEEDRADKALEVAAAISAVSQAGWRGTRPKEQEVKNAMFGVLHDAELVEELFKVIVQQSEF